jgi:hypothetical protein
MLSIEAVLFASTIYFMYVISISYLYIKRKGIKSKESFKWLRLIVLLITAAICYNSTEAIKQFKHKRS